MNIRVIFLANKLPEWLSAAITSYLQRLRPPFAVDFYCVKPKKFSDNVQIEQRMQQQADSIFARVAANSRVIMLDRRGKYLTSEAVAERYTSFLAEGTHISVLIGGPDGFTAEHLTFADEVWSLSALTLPHGLVQLLFVEQTYRAMTILQKHPYHK